jgi:hypothetical protein
MPNCLLLYTNQFKCSSSIYQIIIIENESKLEVRTQEAQGRGQARIISLVVVGERGRRRPLRERLHRGRRGRGVGRLPGALSRSLHRRLVGPQEDQKTEEKGQEEKEGKEKEVTRGVLR